MQRGDDPRTTEQQGPVGFLTYNPDRELVFESTPEGVMVDIVMCARCEIEYGRPQPDCPNCGS